MDYNFTQSEVGHFSSFYIILIIDNDRKIIRLDIFCNIKVKTVSITCKRKGTTYFRCNFCNLRYPVLARLSRVATVPTIHCSAYLSAF